jgi:trk system potassium uptake protein TrkH
MLLIPLLLLPFFPGEIKYARFFIIPSAVSVALGFLLIKLFQKSEKLPISYSIGATIVVFAWIYGWLAGAVPLYMCGQFSISQALFESMSGWTTTGLTVALPDQLPHIVVFWRSLMQYAGGFGFALVMMSLIIGVNTTGAFYAEGHTDEIVPHLRKSALIIIKIYLIYLAIGSISYVFAGMNFFDAVNHCMAALSTGGFSTHNDNISWYKSFPIEIVSIILMIVGNFNFAVHHLAFSGKWKSVLSNDEVRATFITLLIFIPLFFFAIQPHSADYGVGGNSNVIRISVFECVSALTTTGFNSITYTSPILPALPSFILILLMCLGGHTNSTAGGIKQYRVAVFFRAIYWSLKEMFLPRTAVMSFTVMKNENPSFLKDKNIREILLYICLFLATFAIGSLTLMFMGNSVIQSMFEFSSAMGTAGLSTGITSVSTPAPVLWVLLAGMFLGRLEFFAILFVIIRALSDVKHLITNEDGSLQQRA